MTRSEVSHKWVLLRCKTRYFVVSISTMNKNVAGEVDGYCAGKVYEDVVYDPGGEAISC